MNGNLAYADAEQEREFRRWTMKYREPPQYETLNGVIYLMAGASEAHNWVKLNIATMFRVHLRGKKCRPYAENFDVHFSEKDIAKPDVMIVCRPEIIRKNRVYGAPDLVVEILSPSTADRDVTYKKDLYERCGVREYWIVDPVAKSVVVHHLVDGKYKTVGLFQHVSPNDLDDMEEAERAGVRDTIKVSLYDDFEVKVADVFADMMTSYAN